MTGLTQRQRQVWAGIAKHYATTGELPSIRDAARIIGCSSVKGAHDYYLAFERKGLLERVGGVRPWRITEHGAALAGIDHPAALAKEVGGLRGLVRLLLAYPCDGDVAQVARMALNREPYGEQLEAILRRELGGSGQ